MVTVWGNMWKSILLWSSFRNMAMHQIFTSDTLHSQYVYDNYILIKLGAGRNVSLKINIVSRVR